VTTPRSEVVVVWPKAAVVSMQHSIQAHSDCFTAVPPKMNRLTLAQR
jgi:hypothetical protein